MFLPADMAAGDRLDDDFLTDHGRRRIELDPSLDGRRGVFGRLLDTPDASPLAPVQPDECAQTH